MLDKNKRKNPTFLLIFALLIIGSWQQGFEDFVNLEGEGNKKYLDVEEEMVGEEELEDLHLQVGRRLLVEGGLQVRM